MPKVSIITTTHKHEKFITETINSIISQTFSDWELLIGDDSPDDATRNIIQKFITKYPKKIKTRHHKPNKGITDNMNFLLSKVDKTSKYIAFLEGDDLFTSKYLETKLEIFHEFPEIAIVYNNLDFINSQSKIFYKNALQKVPFYLKSKTLTKKQFIKEENRYLSYSTLMIKKSVLEKEKISNPTNDKLFSASDRDLFFRIATKYPCYGIEDSLTLYRRHEESVSRNNQKLFDDLQILIDNYVADGIIDTKLYNYKSSFISLLKSVSYLEQNQRKESMKQLVLSIKYNTFSFPIYKIGILVMNILPNKITKKIINIIIKRNN